MNKPPHLPPEAAKAFGDQVKEDFTNVFGFLRQAARHVRGVSERAERMVSNCSVCLDTGKVGARGHEISCPSCMPVVTAQGVCPTCQGAGTVGSSHARVACPVCATPRSVKGVLR